MRWSVLLLGGLMLGGCGKDLCQKMADDFEDCGVQTSDAELDECREGLSACTKKEEKALEDMLDCMTDAGLFTCDSETGTTTDFDNFDDLIACSMKAISVSPECAGVMSTGGTTTWTPSSTY